jgi:hypothetical protein
LKLAFHGLLRLGRDLRVSVRVSSVVDLTHGLTVNDFDIDPVRRTALGAQS